MYHNLDPENISKYDHANPNARHSMLLPFFEFKNRRLNVLFISINDFIADVLLWLGKIKRKHFGKLKFFS